MSVENHDATIENAETALHLGCEIDMARRVDQVDRAVTPLEGNAGAVDGDAALALFLVVVGLGRAGIDSAQAIRGAGIIEDMLGGRRLAGIDVGDNAQVADPREVFGGHGCLSWRANHMDTVGTERIPAADHRLPEILCIYLGALLSLSWF